MNIPRTNALLWLATALLIMPNGAKSQDYLHTSGGQIADSKGNVVPV
jgi:hypothetical protein